MEKNDLQILKKKIFYYDNTRWNIPFRELKHTVFTVCDWLNPVFPKLDRYKYMDFFLNEIDFDKLLERSENETILKNFNSIYIVFTIVFQSDITDELKRFQNRIQAFKKPELLEYQTKIISLLGNLKEQTGTGEKVSFNAQFIKLYDSIKEQNKTFVLAIDYQLFIGYFNSHIIEYLFNKLSIVNETIDKLLNIKRNDSTLHEEALFHFDKFMQTVNTIILNVGCHLVNEPFNEKDFFKSLYEFKSSKMRLRTHYQKAISGIENAILNKQINIDSLKQIIETRIQNNLICLEHHTPPKGNTKRMFVNHLNNQITPFFDFKNEMEQLFGFNNSNSNEGTAETLPPTKKIETLSDLITHKNSVEIVAAIKTQYKHIGGKRLKLLLKALQELNLLPKERVAKKFHECCKKEFDWNIKSYPAMNDYVFNDITDIEELEEMKGFIQEYIQ